MSVLPCQIGFQLSELSAIFSNTGLETILPFLVDKWDTLIEFWRHPLQLVDVVDHTTPSLSHTVGKLDQLLNIAWLVDLRLIIGCPWTRRPTQLDIRSPISFQSTCGTQRTFHPEPKGNRIAQVSKHHQQCTVVDSKAYPYCAMSWIQSNPQRLGKG